MRNICYQILNDYYQNHTYLNLALKNIDSDKYQVNQIAVRVYGIVSNDELLDYLIAELVQRKKIDNKVRLILKMQIFEYRFLNKEKHIICSEGVNLAKRYAASASGFVNANLRKVEQVKTLMPTFQNEEKNLSITYSHPRFITKALIKQYPQDFMKILKSNTEKKDTFVRQVLPGSLSDEFILIKPFDDLYKYTGGQIVKHPSFLNKQIIIQDIGSYLVGKLVDAKPNQTVLDLCAAPGNKTMHIATTAKLVIANEIHLHRVKLINENISKYNIKNIKTINSDASNFENLKLALKTINHEQKFDKILVDAPCSGWGVIKSKPEIKYNHTKEDIKQILQVSRNIVENSLKFLNKDGQLIFSTCTLNREENDYLIKQICQQFNLREVKDNQIEKFTQNDADVGICLKNYVYNSDSFYMIKLEKNE